MPRLAPRPPSPLLEPPASRGHPLRQQRDGRPAEPPSPPRDHATGCGDGGEGLVRHLGEPPVARLPQPEHVLDPVEDVLDDAAGGRLGGLCDQVVLADLRAPLGDDPRRALPPRRTRRPRRPWPCRPRSARAGGETRAGSWRRGPRRAPRQRRGASSQGPRPGPRTRGRRGRGRPAPRHVHARGRRPSACPSRGRPPSPRRQRCGPPSRGRARHPRGRTRRGGRGTGGAWSRASVPCPSRRQRMRTVSCGYPQPRRH